jgi:hypothetical protein
VRRSWSQRVLQNTGPSRCRRASRVRLSAFWAQQTSLNRGHRFTERLECGVQEEGEK